MSVFTYTGIMDRTLRRGNAAKIYGVAWDKSASPVLTRTDDAVGMVAAAGVDSTPVVNDFDSAPIYSEIIEVTDSYGNTFVRIPRFYIRKTDGVGVKTWQISKSPHGAGWYLPKCFVSPSGATLSHVDVGKYLGSVSGGKLESKAGTYPQINVNIVDFRSYAEANGSGYQQLDIHVVDVIQTLFYVEFATLNSQSVMAGYTSGRYTATDLATVTEVGANRIIVANATAAYYEIGQAISVGTSQGGNQIFYGRTITDIVAYDASNMAIEFDGDPANIAAGNYLYNTGWKNDFSGWIEASSGSLVSNSSGKYPCHYRGIENPWGNVWQFVDGVNINENQSWVCADASQYASNLFASPYERLNYVNHNANGYPVDTGYDSDRPYASLPSAIGGSSSTYFADYYYQNTGQRIAMLGANWNNGSFAGLSFWYLDYSSSNAHVRLSARLLKKPL